MPSAANIHYFAHEGGDRSQKQPPIILIHGAGGSLLSWPPQVRRLPGRRVYAIDLPGHGKSDGVGRHSLEEYAEDVLAFLQALKLRSAILAGISMGGGIALEFSARYPKKAAGLVLMGSSAKLRVAPGILEALENPNLYHSALDTINRNCFTLEAPSQLMDLSKQIMLQIRPSTLLGDFLACDQFDITDRLDQIKTPALIICGAEDRMTPLRHSEALRDSLKGARLEVLPGAGHLVMAEQPEQVADLLTRFIDSIPAGKKPRPAIKP